MKAKLPLLWCLCAAGVEVSARAVRETWFTQLVTQRSLCLTPASRRLIRTWWRRQAAIRFSSVVIPNVYMK